MPARAGPSVPSISVTFVIASVGDAASPDGDAINQINPTNPTNPINLINPINLVN
jgi:hypothetical protein